MSKNSSTSTAHSVLRRSVGRILNALVRTVVHFGVTYPELSEWIKSAYVSALKDELTARGDKVTMSRISLASGVHRKDVKRLLEEMESDAISEKVSLTARLISLWVGDSRFLDEHGEPLALPKSGAISFESLVSEVSVDIRPRTVLDDFLQRNLVLQESDRITLNQAALFPSDDLETKLEFLARNVSDHLLACQHNIASTAPSLPERSVFYDKLSPSSVDELQLLASKESQALILKLNKRAQELAKRDDAEKLNEYHRFILGSYFYREQQKDDSDDA